jgi:homoserine kinase
MAVDLWSEVTVERAEKFEITAEGEGAAEMPKDESNYVVIGLKAAFGAAGKPIPALKYHINCKIPYARGLGSSSAAIVAGIIAGLVLAGHRLPCWGSEALLQVAAGIEVPYILSSLTSVSDTHSILFSSPPFPFRVTLTMLLPPFTVEFRLAFTMEQDGSRNVHPFRQDYSLSCLFPTLKEKHLLLVTF